MTMTETHPNQLKDGRVVGIAGPVIDVEFPAARCPRSTSRRVRRSTSTGETTRCSPRWPSSSARAGCGRLHEADRRPRRGTPVRNTGHGITVPVGDEVLGHVWNVWGDPRRPSRRLRRGWSAGRSTARPRRSTRSSPGARVRDRHQGHRPAHALPRRRQDRPVRRRRRGQDRAHHRDDPPGRPAARRRVGVRRRGRAHP